MNTSNFFATLFLVFCMSISNTFGQGSINELFQSKKRFENNVKEVKCYEYSFDNDKIVDSTLISNMMYEREGSKHKISGQSFYEIGVSHCYTSDSGYNYKVWFHFEFILGKDLKPLRQIRNFTDSDRKKTHYKNLCYFVSEDEIEEHDIINKDTINFKYENGILTDIKTHEYYEYYTVDNKPIRSSKKRSEVINYFFNKSKDSITKEYFQVNLYEKYSDTFNTKKIKFHVKEKEFYINTHIPEDPKSYTQYRTNDLLKSVVYKYNANGLLIENTVDDPADKKKILRKYFYYYN